MGGMHGPPLRFEGRSLTSVREVRDDRRLARGDRAQPYSRRFAPRRPPQAEADVGRLHVGRQFLVADIAGQVDTFFDAQCAGLRHRVVVRHRATGQQQVSPTRSEAGQGTQHSPYPLLWRHEPERPEQHGIVGDSQALAELLTLHDQAGGGRRQAVQGPVTLRPALISAFCILHPAFRTSALRPPTPA